MPVEVVVTPLTEALGPYLYDGDNLWPGEHPVARGLKARPVLVVPLPEEAGDG